MAFQVSCNFARIESYKDALKAWDKGVVFRNEPAIRGLIDKRKKHLTVGRTEAGDIVLRLYGHDTVTWHPDNSVTIRAYSTKSTGVFANRCTPMRMVVTSSNQFRVTVDGRTYRVAGWITFRERDGTWKPDVITPWEVPFVNRERSQQAYRETGYSEFRQWLVVYVQMAARSTEVHGWVSHDKIVGLLRDRKWRELAARYQDVDVERALREIREAIHQQYGCFDYKSVPFLG